MIKLLKANGLKIRQVVVGLSLLSFVFTLVSCTKDPAKIGINIQPEDSWLKVYYTDTTSIYAYSQPGDSVRSDELTRNSIGYINDPVFGSVQAGFSTQFLPSTYGHSFGDTPILDSLVMQLVYSGAFADTNIYLTIHTHEVDTTLDPDSAFYSNIHINTFDIDYSDYSFMPRPHDSFVFQEDTLIPMIRFSLSELSTDLGNYLLAATEADMEDQAGFEAFFKGVYFTCDEVSGDGTFAYFDLINTLSKMTVYYHNTDYDSLSYDYLITSGVSRINTYKHDYSTASSEFQQQVINGDTALGLQQFYVEGYAGVRTIIKIPYMDHWRNLVHVAVNEAKLILPGAPVTQFYDAPPSLALVRRLADNTYEILDDQNEGTEYFGGVYDADFNRYVFRITRYMQSLISDTTTVDYGLYLLVYSRSIRPERFIFSGPEQVIDTAARMKLEVIYTDLE